MDTIACRQVTATAMAGIDRAEGLQQLGLPGRGSGDGVVLDADANDDADSHQPTW